MSDWAGGKRHKGTNQISLNCNLVAVLEHHQKNDTPYAKYNNTYIYIYTCLFISAWCMGYCNNTYLQTILSKRSRGKNDTKTIPQNTIWEPWAGGHPPPTHLNIVTLSALVQRIPIPYFMSESNNLKKRKEEPNKRTKQSNKFSTSPWQSSSQDADMMDWLDPISHIIGSFAGYSPSDMLKQYKFYFYWEGPRTHTHKQTQSFFLTVFAREKAFQ